MATMTYPYPDALVSSEWLADHLKKSNIRVLDGTYFLPNVPRNAHDEFQSEHIPGAAFFDIDDIKDPNSSLPHMLPTPTIFSSKIRKLGINNNDRIIIYDRMGFFSAPRVWWTFRIFGHENVAILDGGLHKWLVEGRPTSGSENIWHPSHFLASFNTDMVRNAEQVMENLQSKNELVIDARPSDRFEGIAPEPREGLARGHIPASLNLMPSQFVSNDTHTLLPSDAITAQFKNIGITPDTPILTTCGSGVAASAITFVRYLMTGKVAPVYDGSWSEWGAIEHAPTVTGKS